MSIISEASSVYNFRQDLISEKLTQLLKQLKEVAVLEAKKSQEPVKAEDSPHEPADSTPPITKESIMQEMSKLIKSEMELLGNLAKADPKCYQIWYHRKWMFEKIWEVESALKIKGMISLKCLAADTEVCEKFLIKDERNFHVWNYRSFLTAYRLEKFPDDAIKVLKGELKFLESKLDKNFSNYSAIHFKGKYLLLLSKYLHKEAYGQLPDEAIPLGRKRLQRELEFVNKGLTIAPYEQSLWIYLGWLLDRVKLVTISGISIKARDLDKPEDPHQLVVKLTALGATRNVITANWDDVRIKLNGAKIIESEHETGLQHIELDAGRDSFEISCDNTPIIVNTDQKIDAELDDDTVPSHAFIFPKTTIHLVIAQINFEMKIHENGVELIHLGPGGLKVEYETASADFETHIETLRVIWEQALQYVQEIVSTEQTNKEAVLNYVELCVSQILQRSNKVHKISR